MPLFDANVSMKSTVHFCSTSEAGPYLPCVPKADPAAHDAAAIPAVADAAYYTSLEELRIAA
jgi:hypothetical protein